jgi:gas vesicle protein
MFVPKAGVSNNMNQVVQELRQVRQEIAQLRKDQQQQTGDLIVSNYDANNRAAEAITTEVANTATQKEWQQRNKVAVV